MIMMLMLIMSQKPVHNAAKSSEAKSNGRQQVCKGKTETATRSNS
jgi:hypothetical protein